ncbi:hypothetical protein IIA16_04290 [bacterium]|nr:hypothetical protein [bacterium]
MFVPILPTGQRPARTKRGHRTDIRRTHLRVARTLHPGDFRPPARDDGRYETTRLNIAVIVVGVGILRLFGAI